MLSSMTTATASDPLALDRQVCFALVTTARRVVALYGPVLEPLGPPFDPSTVTTTSTTWDNTKRPAVESRVEKTEAANETRLVHTVRGVGYVLREE